MRESNSFVSGAFQIQQQHLDICVDINSWSDQVIHKNIPISSLSMHTQIYSALLMQFIIWKVSKHFLVSREQALCLKPVTKFLVLELHYITYFVDLPDRCTRSAYDLQKQTKPTVHPVHNRVPCSAVLRPQTKTLNILIQS